jgi:cell division protein ZapB
MNAEFDTLDGKIDQFLQLCQRLKSENRELRLQLVSSQDNVKRLEDKVDSAKTRLDALLRHCSPQSPMSTRR